MRFLQAILLAGLAVSALIPLVLAGGAAAQSYSGQDVSVNPLPAGGGVLLYPGGQYMRVVRPLLQPGERPNGAIQLHMPSKRAPARVARTQVPEAERSVETAPPPPRPPSVRPAAPAPKLARAEPAPPRTTRPSPAAPSPAAPGLTKRSMITFAPQSTDPAESALGAIKFLATDLNTAMTGPGSRVQLQAYGGTRGDKGSDARRLSLKRALAIRQVLIDDGVPADRIDVHAAGGVDDDGPADRVDVYIKA